jgi:hypothetical protein
LLLLLRVRESARHLAVVAAVIVAFVVAPRRADAEPGAARPAEDATCPTLPLPAPPPPVVLDPRLERVPQTSFARLVATVHGRERLAQSAPSATLDRWTALWFLAGSYVDLANRAARDADEAAVEVRRLVRLGATDDAWDARRRAEERDALAHDTRAAAMRTYEQLLHEARACDTPAPLVAEAKYFLALEYEHGGDTTKASALYAQVASFAPRSLYAPHARVAVADALYRGAIAGTHSWAEARAAYLAAREARGPEPLAQYVSYKLAHVYAHLGDEPSAVRALDDASTRSGSASVTRAATNALAVLRKMAACGRSRAARP